MKTNSVVFILLITAFLIFIAAVILILAVQETFSSLFSPGVSTGNAARKARNNTLASRLP